MSLFGDFEHHLKISVGYYIPNSRVMLNWDIYQPLYLKAFAQCSVVVHHALNQTGSTIWHVWAWWLSWAGFEKPSRILDRKHMNHKMNTQSHSHSILNLVQRERYIRMLVAFGCPWPGSLNFLLERPHVCQYIIVYICIYMYIYICTIIRSRVPQFRNFWM